MFIGCHVCHTSLDLSQNTISNVCDKCKHVEKIFNDLTGRLEKAESFSYWTQQKMKTLLRLVCKEIEAGAESVSVPSHLLKDLIEVANPYKKHDFWTDTLLTRKIIMDGADMIRARGTKLFPKVFGMMAKHVGEYYALHGWAYPIRGDVISRNIWDAPPLYISWFDYLMGRK